MTATWMGRMQVKWQLILGRVCGGRIQLRIFAGTTFLTAKRFTQ